MNRYERHISLPQIGAEGQQSLRQSRVLMVGAGGLGCPALQYLAAAGIGTLGIVDGDTVELSNLQRQILYTTKDIGRRKSEAAKEHLSALNPDISILSYPENITAVNALNLISDYEIIIDGTDSLATRYLLNDACVKLNRPLVHGSVHKFEGQVSVFNYHGGPTYRCLFPDRPSQDQFPNCSETGVLGVLPGMVGIQLAAEVLKMILGIGEPLSGKLKLINVLTNTEEIILFGRNEEQIQKALATAFDDNDSPTDCHATETVQPAELLEWITQKRAINFLDVREHYETPKLDVPNVLSIPLAQVLSRADELPLDLPLIVFCQHGVRSKHAIGLLKKICFQNKLIDLRGGMAAFVQYRSGK